MTDLLIDEQFLPAAQHLIETAQKTIYIATFKLEISAKSRGKKVKKLIDAIVEKAACGLDVRLLINQIDNRGHIPNSNHHAINYLRPWGVKVRHLPNNRVCHAKVLLIDKQIAILGSHNLSIKSCHNNFEMSCILTEDQPVLLLNSAYERIWNVSKAH